MYTYLSIHVIIIRYYWSNGYYREPGNAGYSVDNPSMEHHLNSCIDNDTGAPTECLLPPGSSYIACEDGRGDETGVCEVMKPCPKQNEQGAQSSSCGGGGGGGSDNDNSTSCSTLEQDSAADLKWCRQYTIEVADALSSATTTKTTTPTTGRGFVPLTNMCITPKGHFSQVPNQVIDPLASSRDVTSTQTCTYGNGEPVQRNVAGAYAACGASPSTSGNNNNGTTTTTTNNAVCDTVFQGGYASWEYDPRYRPWYILTKELQKSIWMKPFPFFDLAMGVTYASPIYSTDDATGREVFAGVLAVDYRCKCCIVMLVYGFRGSFVFRFALV
jgi:hypothetical protein